MQHARAYNFGISGSNLMKLYQPTRCEVLGQNFQNPARFLTTHGIDRHNENLNSM